MLRSVRSAARIALFALLASLLIAPLAPASGLSTGLLQRTSGFASTLSSDVAARYYQEMSYMGARAAGFLPLPDADAAASPSLGRAPLPSVIGSPDLIVHSLAAPGVQGETAIAANGSGSILIAGYNDSRGFSVTPLSVSGVARSNDGGASWGEVPVGPGGLGVLPSAVNGSVFGDPDVKYDPTRDCFIYSSIYIRPGDGLQGLCIFYSNSGPSAGTSWTGPIEVGPSFVSNGAADKPFIDVNTLTGRLLITWTHFPNVGTVSIRRTYTDDLGTSWATVATIASGTFQSSVPRFLPAASNAASVAYVAWRALPTATTRDVQMSRSTDGGVTWSAAASILSGTFPGEDQIVGVDRVNTSPEMAIDYGSGRVYVVYQTNSALGEGDVAFRSFVGAPAAASATLLSSRPGLDRAQFYPFVTVDQSTHRVHVLWYDGDASLQGDLTELMHTYSDDQGATWSPPTPVLDRPFHAGYGNDTSQPNLGDYFESVAVNGTLHSVAAGTSLEPLFDEGQPSAQLYSPDVYYDATAEGTTHPALRITAAALADDLCGPGNGSLEPGETGELTFTLQNYVTNAVVGAGTYTNVSAALSTTTPGVTITDSPQAFSDLTAGASGSNALPFTIRLDPSFVPGAPVDLILAVQSDFGSIELPWRLDTGTDDTPIVVLNEDFTSTSITVSQTPPTTVWASVNGGSTTNVAWTVSTTIPGVGAGANNGAFHADGTSTGWYRLWSPYLVLPAPAGESYVSLDFDIAYSTEDEPTLKVQAYDGLTLRITDQTVGATVRSVLAEAFVKQFAGFTKHLPRSSSASYFEDMAVWAGYSNGIQHVRMTFPGEGMTGRTVQLRFEWTQDSNSDCTAAGHPGPCGVWLDNIVMQVVPVTSTFALQGTSTSVVADANPSTAGSPVQFTATVTPGSVDGTVEFFDGATSLGSSPLSGGVATLVTSDLSTGSHAITAEYSGDACDTSSVSDEYKQDVNGATGVDDGPVAAFALTGVVPNPTSARTRIGYTLPAEAPVDLSVLDVQGRVVATLVRGIVSAGAHTATWDARSGGRRMEAGLYFVRFRAAGRVVTRRLVLAP